MLIRKPIMPSPKERCVECDKPLLSDIIKIPMEGGELTFCSIECHHEYFGINGGTEQEMREQFFKHESHIISLTRGISVSGPSLASCIAHLEPDPDEVLLTFFSAESAWANLEQMPSCQVIIIDENLTDEQSPGELFPAEAFVRDTEDLGYSCSFQDSIDVAIGFGLTLPSKGSSDEEMSELVPPVLRSLGIIPNIWEAKLLKYDSAYVIKCANLVVCLLPTVESMPKKPARKQAARKPTRKGLRLVE